MSRSKRPAAASTPSPPHPREAAPEARRSERASDPELHAAEQQAPGGDDDARQAKAALDRFVSQSNAEIHGLFEILGRKRRLLTVNFLAGLSRGVGFFVGMTLVGGLFLGSVALAVDWTASVFGWKDVTFRSLMEVVARKAMEAKDVWEDVKQGDTAPVASPAPGDTAAGTATPPDAEPATPAEPAGDGGR